MKSPAPVLEFCVAIFLIILPPLAFIEFYCAGIARGIAEARNARHRLTSQSPWFLFDRQFVPSTNRACLIPVGLFALQAVAVWILFASNANPGGFLNDAMEGRFLALQFTAAWSVLIIAPFLGPHCKSPWLLMTLSCLVSLVLWLPIVLLGEFIISLLGPQPAAKLMGLGSGLRVLVFLATAVVVVIGFSVPRSCWRYVRHGLGDRWFRFDRP